MHECTHAHTVHTHSQTQHSPVSPCQHLPQLITQACDASTWHLQSRRAGNACVVVDSQTLGLRIVKVKNRLLSIMRNPTLFFACKLLILFVQVLFALLCLDDHIAQLQI